MNHVEMQGYKIPKGDTSDMILQNKNSRNERNDIDHIEIEIEPKQTADFDLNISNVELERLYIYQESEIPCANELNSWINDKMMYWNSENKQVKFNFPEQFLSPPANSPIEIIPQHVTYKPNSLFPSVLLPKDKERNQKNENHQENQNHQHETQKVYDELNKKQLSEVWNKAMFTVYYGYGEPEIWEVRPWVFYGKKKSLDFLKESLEYAKFQFKQIKRRFFTEYTLDFILHNQKNLMVNSENCDCSCLDINMLEGIRVLLGIPVHLVVLLIGIPLFNVDESELEKQKLKVIQQRMEKELLTQSGRDKYTDLLFLRHLIENRDIYQKTELNFSEEQEIISILKQIAEGTLELAHTEEEKPLAKIELQDKLYDHLIKRARKYFVENHDVNEKICDSLERTFKSFICVYRQSILGKQQIHHYGKQEMVLKELRNLNCRPQENLVQLLIDELKRGIGILEERNLINKIKVVSKKNHLEFSRFIPKVVREQVQDRYVYSAEWKQEVTVPTSFFFWKIIFFFVSSYFMIHKFMKSCLYFAIYSPCGLKSAFYTNQFSNYFTVNQETGKIEDHPGSLEETVTYMYNQIKKEARANVRSFENEPDHGLLGKSITRICNRLDNWFIRYFIIGFILVNILLRALFFMIGIISLVLVPLSLVLAPLYTFLCMIACLFCYDFTVPLGHMDWDLPVFAPIFDLLIWRLIGRGIGQIFLSILMIGFHIFFGVALIAFGFVVYVSRRILDAVVYIFIYSCGRIPGGDSYLAWKVTRQQRFMSELVGGSKSNKQKAYQAGSQNGEQSQILDQLTINQIYQLVDAEFEKQVLDLFKSEMYQKINEPIVNNDIKIKKMLEYLPFEYQQNRVSSEYHSSATKLKTALDSQILQRKKLLPTIQRRNQPNFSYKRENIVNIYNLLQSYLFQKYGSVPFYYKFMWSHYKCETDKYDVLALQFLSLIFFDNKVPPTQVLEKLTLKESQSKTIQIRAQIDEFLDSRYRTGTSQLAEPPNFIQFSAFIEKVLKRQEFNQPIISLRSSSIRNIDEFIILNANRIDADQNKK